MNGLDGPLLTPHEAAQQLDVDPNTVRRWCSSGQLRALRAGHQWRIPASAVEDLIRALYDTNDPEDDNL